MTFKNGIITFRINEQSFGKLFEGVPESKELDLGMDERPTPYIRCESKDTRLELLNYWGVEYTDDKILFDFNAEFFEMT